MFPLRVCGAIVSPNDPMVLFGVYLFVWIVGPLLLSAVVPSFILACCDPPKCFMGRSIVLFSASFRNELMIQQGLHGGACDAGQNMPKQPAANVFKQYFVFSS